MRLSYEGDPADVLPWVGKSQQELGRLRERLKALGVEQGTFQHALSADAYCYGYILPTGLEMLHIVAAPGAGKIKVENLVTPIVPDFISGVTIGTLIKPDKQGAMAYEHYYPTPNSVLQHPNEVKKPAWKKQRSTRLALEVDSSFPELETNPRSLYRMGQTALLHATMYSGQMKHLVQVLLGFGRPDVESIYAPLVQSVREEDRPPATTFEREAARQGLKVQYDYRYARTHGLITGADGALWLVEVSITRGVAALPLPLNPYTRAVDHDWPFRDALRDRRDTEGVAVLDMFGGFPTGEPFPFWDAFDAYKRAGRVVQLASVEALNHVIGDYTPFSQAMGWAFADNGKVADNTAWRWGDDGVQRCGHFRVQFNIGAMGAITPVDGANDLKRELDALRNYAGPDVALKGRIASCLDAAQWKVDRLSTLQYGLISQTLANSGLAAAFIELDELVLAPLATGAAAVLRLSEGKLWWNALASQPQLKFPEYSLGMLISHDMRPSEHTEAPHCDTIVHVFYKGNQLEWCKFFNDPRQFAYVTWSDYVGASAMDVEHLPVGHLERRKYHGDGHITSGFYTNRYDNRELLAQSVIEEIFERTDGGYYEVLSEGYGVGDRSTGVPGLMPLDPPVGFDPESGGYDQYVWRNKKFAWHAYSSEKSRPTVKTAIAVPVYYREAYYYAHWRQTGEDLKIHQFHWHKMVDPYFGVAGRLTPEAGPEEVFVKRGGLATANEGNEWWETYKSYAGGGAWVPVGSPIQDIVTTELINLNAEAYDEVIRTPLRSVLNVYLVADSPQTPVLAYHDDRENDLYWEGGLWFIPSPDDMGDYQSIVAMANANGTEVIAYQPQLNVGPLAVKGRPDLGPDMRGDRQHVPGVNWIGVVNA